jgi:hypothetical protein
VASFQERNAGCGSRVKQPFNRTVT